MNRFMQQTIRAAAGAVALGLAAASSALAAEAAAPRPNILVMLSDDMGWGQVGFQGGDVIATPNLDRLREQGVSLTQFYVQPVCTPTRACFLTGRYATRTGTVVRFTANDTAGMLLDERTIAEALRDAGYFTAICGKWHLGSWQKVHLPMQRGFEHQYGHYGALVDYWLHSRGGVYDWHRNEQPIDEDGYSTYLIADEAVRLIESQNGERPFFLYVPFNAVHSPYAKQAPPELIAKYQGTGVNPDQAAQVEAMDIAIGRILEALDAKGLGDDTLVWFFNDNGGTGVVKQNGPYRDFKCAYFEGGIRVASVVRWPGKIPANSTSDEMLHCVDMYPTLIRLAGGSLEQPLPLDGLDAWATIAEGAPSPRQEILHGPDTIRVGDWKYIDGAAEYYSWKAGEDWLFNIREDPGETNNLLAAFPEKAEELRQRLAYWKTQERPAEEKDKIPGHPNWLFGEEENKTEPPAWLIERMTKARAGADATLNEGGEGAAPRERPRRANREERGGQ